MINAQPRLVNFAVSVTDATPSYVVGVCRISTAYPFGFATSNFAATASASVAATVRSG